MVTQNAFCWKNILPTQQAEIRALTKRDAAKNAQSPYTACAGLFFRAILCG